MKQKIKYLILKNGTTTKNCCWMPFGFEKFDFFHFDKKKTLKINISLVVGCAAVSGFLILVPILGRITID